MRDTHYQNDSLRNGILADAEVLSLIIIVSEYFVFVCPMVRASFFSSSFVPSRLHKIKLTERRNNPFNFFLLFNIIQYDIMLYIKITPFRYICTYNLYVFVRPFLCLPVLSPHKGIDECIQRAVTYYFIMFFIFLLLLLHFQEIKE